MDPNSTSHIQGAPAQEALKFHQESNGTVESTRPLPETYYEDRIVIMARDPNWLFGYWDFTHGRLQTLRDRVGPELWNQGQAVVRIYDVTGVESEISMAHRSFDVEISLDDRRRYLKVPESGRSYIAELGFRFPNGLFLALSRSNRVTMPFGRLSDQTDSRWMIVNVREWERMVESATGAGIQTRGSAELVKMMTQRSEFLRSVFSGSSSLLSGSSGTVPGLVPPEDTKR